MTSSNLSRPRSRICRRRVSIAIGRVDAVLNVTLYGPSTRSVGLRNPYFALRTTHSSPNRSAYSRFTLKGAPVYVSRAGVGPAFGAPSQILALPHGTMTRVRLTARLVVRRGRDRKAGIWGIGGWGADRRGGRCA